MDNLELQICNDEYSTNKAYNLRYRSYRSVDAIDPSVDELFADEFDMYPSSHTFILNNGDNAVASIRACVGRTSDGSISNLPSNRIYTEELADFLGEDAIVLESSRFVTAPEYDQKALIRFSGIFLSIALCAKHYKCTHVVTAVREDQRSFYSKYFNLQKLSEEKKYLGLKAMMVLTGSDKDNFDYSRLERSKNTINFDPDHISTFLSSES